MNTQIAMSTTKYCQLILFVFSTNILACQISNDNNFSYDFNVRGLNEWEQLLAKHCPKIGLDPLEPNTLTKNLNICEIHIYKHILNRDSTAIEDSVKNNRIDSLVTKSYFYSSNGELDSIYSSYIHWDFAPVPFVTLKLFFSYQSDTFVIVNKTKWKPVYHSIYTLENARQPRTILNSHYDYWDFGKPRKCINFLSNY